MALVRRVSFRRTREQNTRKLSRDAQVQLNGKPQLVVVSDGKKAQGLLANDVTIRPTSNGVAIGVADGHGNTNETVLSRTQFSNQKAPQSGSGAPTTAQFPNNGDYGWYTDTSSSKNYFVINLSGTITNITISTLSGSITYAQHGNLSGAGNAHAFGDITGTITDTQHGSRGGGSLHAIATGSVNGFMSSTQANTLGTVNTTVSDITSGGAASHNLNCLQLFINGTASVGAALSSVSTVSQTAGATYTSNEQAMLNALKTATNALINRMQGQGLIT